MAEWELFGNINRIGPAKVDGSKSLLEILREDARGMADDRNPEIVQLGGPLGPMATGESLTRPLADFREDMDFPTVMFLNDKFCPVDYGRFIVKYVKKEMGIDSEDLDTLWSLLEELSSGISRKYTYEELIREVKEPTRDGVISKVRGNLSYLMDRYEGIFREHFENKKCAAGICHRLFPAQCVNACPAEINIPGYIALMYQGRDEEAYRLMRQNNPLSLICGKICARPCEAKCRRGEIEKTVGVRALKHYAATAALGEGFTEEKRPGNGKRVGIIGAGPAGLSAAYYLGKTGYDVDVYEKHPVAGGMLAVGVPSYRLSQGSIDKEVKLIENLGVRIHRNTEIGGDVSFPELKEKHDALLLSSGCHVPNLFSDHLENLESAIDFLREVKLNGRTDVGGKVIVIGGGDVAMDAARTAVRLGAGNVDVVSLERYGQMPANEEEKEEARQEGIIFHNGYGTKNIHEKDSNAHGITFKKCLDLYDVTNRFDPVYDDDDTLDLSCDHIILAIGQRSDLKYLGGSVKLDDRGRILMDGKGATSLDGVYAAGDMGGPGSAVKAIGEGRKAAGEIDAFLGGTGLCIGEEIDVPAEQSHYALWDREGRSEKVELFAKGCPTPFNENRAVFTEEMARAEALRCMRCDRNSRQ